jgi:uncharacterized phage protein (TIGR01671 family)
VVVLREIKFRGKRKDNGYWVYGYYVYVPQLQEGQIFTGEIKHSGTTPGSLKRHNVDPATVGQYIGLKDESGEEIYEGDYLKAKDSYTGLYFEGYVTFDNGSFVIKSECMTHYRWIDYEKYIVGNIYEDPSFNIRCNRNGLHDRGNNNHRHVTRK